MVFLLVVKMVSSTKVSVTPLNELSYSGFTKLLLGADLGTLDLILPHFYGAAQGYTREDAVIMKQ